MSLQLCCVYNPWYNTTGHKDNDSNFQAILLWLESPYKRSIFKGIIIGNECT
jgi:hypothetical protein